MTLRDDILAKCPELVASRDEAAISRVLSVGRLRPSHVEIGNGTVLETLGIAAANAFLDVVSGTPDFRYVKPLLDQGRLKIGSALVQATIKSMVPLVLTQAQADALCALGLEADIVSVNDIAHALEGM